MKRNHFLLQRPIVFRVILALPLARGTRASNTVLAPPRVFSVLPRGFSTIRDCFQSITRPDFILTEANGRQSAWSVWVTVKTFSTRKALPTCIRIFYLQTWQKFNLTIFLFYEQSATGLHSVHIKLPYVSPQGLVN